MHHPPKRPSWYENPTIMRIVIFCVALASSILLLAAYFHGPIASAAEAERPALRIGILRPSGIGALSDSLAHSQALGLTELSKYTDWDYEPVPVTMEDAAARLASGDIDLLLPAPPSLAADSAFAVTRPLALRDILALYGRKGETRYAEHDLRTLGAARVGVPDGRPDLTAPFAAFCARNGLALTAVPFADATAAHAALADGSIDLLLDTAAGAGDDEAFVLAFDSVPVSILGRADRLDLIHGIDNASFALTQENPLYAPHITERFLRKTRHLTLHFTPEERAFIENLGTLTVVLSDDDPDDALHEDLLGILARDTGLTLAFQHVDSREEALVLLEQGTADLLPDLYSRSSDTHAFYYTNPIESEPFVLIGREGQAMPKGGVIALPTKDDTFEAAAQELFPGWTLLPCKNEQHALAAVASGRADLAFAAVHSLEASRNLLLYPKLAPVTDTARYTMNTSLAIASQRGRMLQSVLNKAILRLDPQEKEQLALRYELAQPQRFSFAYLFAFYPLQTLIGATILITLLVLWREERRRRRRKEQEAVARENFHYQSAIDTYKHQADTDALTGTCNKAAAQRIVTKFLAEAPAPGHCHAFFICDLDHFKDANDLCGHAFGDEILKAFAGGLRKLVRSCDLIGRFGGDEFVLFLPNAEQHMLPELASLINAMAHRIDERERATDPKVAAHPERPVLSVSIGIAVAESAEMDYEKLFRQADHALYDVKEHGRNGYHIYGEESVHRVELATERKA